LQNPTHTYAQTGTYNVCLTITTQINGITCTDTHCQNVILGQQQVCSASFTTAYIGGGTGIQFTSNSTGTNANTSYSWTFGDGGTSNLQNPSHTYAQPGTYHVCLTITVNNNGTFCTDTHCQNVIIEVSPGNILQAQARLQAAYISPDAMLHFNYESASSSHASIQLFDIAGALIQSFNYKLNPGTNQIKLENSGLKNNFYILKVNTGNKIISQKVLIIQ
jgi:PKD repeat protein